RLTRLSEDLLLLARADREELRLERRRVPVADLLAEAGARMRRAYGAGIEVEVEPGAADEVDADPARVEQALANLVANAFRYGAEHVRIRAAAHGRDAVRVHVSDDGPGFDPEFLPRAFARFARAPGESRASGSGLGLAIVAAIARAHGGEAGARNLERGADVWIALPRSGADQAGASSTGTTSTGTRL
ncbi:MAG TPA: HAMP domain-containing sensor histidine kinase, partial [Solirubrobacteraceae bacterium]|nr:HAMP domain-containing sensor histidine kinase [Solirubrobacteraceae bacterium]